MVPATTLATGPAAIVNLIICKTAMSGCTQAKIAARMLRVPGSRSTKQLAKETTERNVVCS